MSADLFVGVDIGTQGVKAGIYDERGACHGEAFRRSDLKHPAPGAVEEDPEQQLRSACECIAECVARAEGRGVVRAVAIDGQMAGIIGVGDDGRNVTPYDSWLDTRCSPWITRMKETAGERVVKMTGGPPSFNHGPKILWWKNERPETFRRVRSWVQPGGYAAMRLCGLDGGRAFVDRSYLHFSGFADSEAGAWDAGLCSTFGVDPATLPRIVAPSDVVGVVTAEMAAVCGLAAGTPVVAGCGDTAASFLSCGATRPGICVDVAGTASVFAATTRDYRPDEKAMILSCGRSATPGLWHPYAYVNGGGMNLEWFKDTVAAQLAAAAGTTRAQDAQSAGPDLVRLGELAAAVAPAEDDPYFVPHLGGRVSPSQPLLRGAWTGLTWAHGPGHLYRAILEGVALEYGIYLRTVESLFGKGTVSELRVTGGGEKSALWNQIKADTLGVRIVQVQGSGGAPLGAAMLAGHGAGFLADLDATAKEWIRTGSVTEPDPRRAAVCGKRLERYASLLGALNAWAEDN
ncbi:MAG TPA: FGGY family carbohydrate kinase [Spirochaetia bacterium]